MWSWSDRDEHRTVIVMLGAAIAFGLLVRVLPRYVDVVHTFEHSLGLMAPTCGLTRAGIALLRGDLATAWTYNPAIFLVGPFAVVLVARFAAGVIAGRWLTLRAHPGWVGRFVGAALIVPLWLNQQAHFAVLAR